MQYENHMLENELLPFIFHFDIIKIQEKGEFNAFGNWHENPEFLFYTKGRGNLLYNKHNYEVEAGDLAIINSDCFHAVSTDDEVEYFCLIVDAGFFRDNGIPIDSVTYEHLIKNSDMKSAFERIAFLYTEKPEYYCAKIRSEVLKLIIYLTENYMMSDSDKEEFPVSIKEAVTFIKTNYAEDITISDIVRQVGFSRAYFSRAFKKHTGVSVITYLNYIRCSQARTLLGTGKATVSQAAQVCGFKNFSYFSKTYKHLMGVLPSADMKSGGKSEEPQMKLIQNKF